MAGTSDSYAGQLQAGSRALFVLADPVSVSILRQLGVGPLEGTELLERVGFMSRSTYFERMRGLEELSLVSRERRGYVPPVIECKLEASGVQLLSVARRLEGWLAEAPQGPLKLGEPYATAAVKALAVAWGSTLLRWLAERPRSMTELEQVVHILGYRKLERIVRELVSVDLIEPVAIEGRSKQYGVTEWGRWATGLLTAAMRWERQEVATRSAPIGPVEAEGVMLLGVPLIKLPDETSGNCALLVDGASPDMESLGGAVVEVGNGRAMAWHAAGGLDLDKVALEADCWVRGSALVWLGFPPHAPGPALRIGGDLGFAETMIGALREMVSTTFPVIPAGGTHSF